MFNNYFEIRIDASKCTSLVEGGAFLDGKKHMILGVLKILSWN